MLNFWSNKTIADESKIEKLKSSQQVMLSAIASTASVADSIAEHLKVRTEAISGSDDAVLLCDFTGKIVRCTGACELFATDAVLQRPVNELLDAGSHGFAEFWNAWLADPPEHPVRMVATAGSGEQFPVNVMVAQIHRPKPEILLLVRRLISDNANHSLHVQRFDRIKERTG